MITGTILLLAMWLDKNDNFLLIWTLGLACAFESIMTIDSIAKIFGA